MALNQQEDHLGASSTAQSTPKQQADSERCCQKPCEQQQTSKGELSQFCSVPGWKTCGETKAAAEQHKAKMTKELQNDKSK